MEEGLGEAGAMTVAFGEGVDGLGADVLEKAGFNNAVDSRAFGFAAESTKVSAEGEKSADGHVVIEGGGFGEVSNFLLCGETVFFDVDAADTGGAFGGREVAGDAAHGGGFPRTVRTEKSEDFAFFDGEGKIFDGGFESESFGELFGFYHF